MNELFKKGDRVRHPVKTDWGLGEVLENQIGDRVQILFEDVGVKKFALETITFVKVVGDEAESPYLDALVKHQGKKRTNKPGKPAATHVSFPDAVKIFLGGFKGGFRDPKYLQSERDYKLKARKYLVDHLSREQVAAFIESARYSEMCDQARKLINQTVLIHHYEKIWLNNGLTSDLRQAFFARELANLLYGASPLKERFESFVKMLYDIGAAKWTIATYFLFLAYPESQLFVKPEVTQHAAGMLGLDIRYQAEVNWLTYERILHMAETLKGRLVSEGLEKLDPQDMIDVQSFIWIIGPGYFV
jgi:hypothetical protein